MSGAEALDGAALGDAEAGEQSAGADGADAGERFEDPAHPELAGTGHGGRSFR